MRKAGWGPAKAVTKARFSVRPVSLTSARKRLAEVTLWALPDADSLKAVGRLTSMPAMSRSRTVPLTVARTVSGLSGYALTNCPGSPPAKRMMSCLPTEASKRRSILPGLRSSMALKSTDASALTSESGVRNDSEGRLRRTESMSTRPFRSESLMPLFSSMRQ